jgi:hypothetical protein
VPIFRDLISSLNHNDTALVNALNLIDLIQGWSGKIFAPLPLIRAVNYLHQLGWDKSLQALCLYCDLIDQMEEQLTTDVDIRDFVEKPAKVLSGARLLFVSKKPQTILPEIWIGRPNIMPKKQSLFPLFPLTLYQDIPFALASSYITLSTPDPPQEYLEWCSREGKLREKPLQPNNNPLNSVDEFLNSKFWHDLVNEETRFFRETEFYRMLRMQALRTVSNIYPISEEDEYDFLWRCSDEKADRLWEQHKQAVDRLQIRWNPATNEFDCGISS